MDETNDAPAAAAEIGVEPAAPTGTAGTSKRRRRRKGKGGGATARAGQYWMIVSSPENIRRTREHGYTVQGVKAGHRRRAESMRTGDRLLYYVTGRMAFAGAVTVTSEMFEDHQPIWRSARRDEDYPWRVRIRPDLVLDESEWISARDLAFRLDYVSKWAPEDWSLAFQGHLHQIPRTDFTIIEAEFRRVRRGRRGARPDPRGAGLQVDAAAAPEEER